MALLDMAEHLLEKDSLAWESHSMYHDCAHG